MKKSRVIALFLVLAMTFSLCATAAPVEEMGTEADRARAINVLLQSGWTIEEIEDLLTDEALLAFKNVQPAISSEQKYFRVTEDAVYEITAEECETQLQAIEMAKNSGNELGVAPMSVIPVGDYEKKEVASKDGYMTYFVQAYNAGEGKYILSARFEWLKNPEITGIDVFGLGHDKDLNQTNSKPYTVYKCDVLEVDALGSTHIAVERSLDDCLTIDTGGSAVTIELENTIVTGIGPVARYASNHRGYMQYEVEIKNENVKAYSIYAEYLHQNVVISVSPSVSYPVGGSLSVTFQNQFDRITPNPYLSFER